MEFDGQISYSATLEAKLIHADGSVENVGVLAASRPSWFKAFLLRLIRQLSDERGIATTAGVNYMATDFASGGVTPTISGFKFHASGTGTTAAAVTDTAMQTDSGVARVSGTASNPAANQYRSVATMAYTSTLAITEWGLFSALTAGTLWDRRVFSAINVVSGDSVQFTFTETISNGGS